MSTKNRPYRTIAAGFLALLAAFVAAPSWAAAAGKFVAVVGDVEVVDRSGQRRTVRTGEELNAGDTVVTSSGALAQLRLADGGLISVRADTRFTLDDFSFEQEASRLGRMFISLVKGSLRSLTGLIGNRNPGGYRIKTPHATIGVRGTDHETFVITTPQPGGFQPGTFDWCFEGRTIVQSQAGAVVVAPRQVAYVAAADLRPTLLPEIPEFLRNRAMAQPQVQRGGGTQPEAGVQPAKSTDPKSQVLRTLPESKTLAPRTGLEAPTTQLKKEPVLINPLLTPISPSATTDPKPAPSLEPIAPTTTTSPTLESAPTTIPPRLTSPPPAVKTPVGPMTTPTRKTVPPTTISPSATKISPTLKGAAPPATKTVPPK